MAKKKQDKITNLGQGGDTKSIRDVISPFVDPDNSLMVRVTEDAVIVNATQVPKQHLDSLIEEMEYHPYNLIVIVGHPDNVEL